MKIRVLFLLLWLCSFNRLLSQEQLPFVENFTKSEYLGDNQVWNVVQGSDNAMYFANNHYMLRYNGVKWERYSLPNHTIIRSLYADGDRIYCGSYKEFGYWTRVHGKMKYFSVSANKGLFEGNAENEEIWKIFKHKGQVYFQSFNVLYKMAGRSIERIKFPSQISYCYVLEDKIFVASVLNGVYELENKHFEQVTAWPQLKGNVIHGIGTYKDRVYTFTKSNGVFTGTSSGLEVWGNPLNETLKNDVILTAKFISTDILAIGTALNGLYIVDMKSGAYKTINRGNLLKNNAVLSIEADRENDLWLGLDNGIAHVEINSPVEIFTDNTGILGSVYALSDTPRGYLLATNHGLFTYSGKVLSTVPESQGQVWDIYKHGNTPIIGHNDGTFIYKNGLRKANTVSGGWSMLKSSFENVYFQAHYSGISIYKDINDLSRPKYMGITKPIRHIVQDRAGEIWAADLYRGLYRIKYDDEYNIKKIHNVASENGIQNDYNVKLFNFRNQLYFYLNNTWYTFNGISQKLEVNKLFNSTFKGISDVIAINNDNFLIIKGGLVYTVSLRDNKFLIKLLPEKYYKGRLILDNTSVHTIGDRLYINLDDGFLALTAGQRKISEPQVVVEAFYNGELIAEGSDVRYNQPVEINLIPQYFGFNRPELFYRLNSDGEFNVAKDGLIQLNNLTSGRQSLEVFYNNGEANVKVAEYNFNVERPWYFSFIMIIIYVFIITAALFLYNRWNKIRYAEKIKLNEEELKHQRKIMELEMEAEKKLRQQEYEKQMLEVEVQNKASEVAGKSLSIAKHSEMIESIQEVLEQDINSEQLKGKIRKIIKSNTISKNEWQHFEKNLIKSHDEFVNKLSKKYPSLTPKDIKLCIYLKMNLASKEIAPLMNISFRGVELHRYRLRKKIGLAKDDSLSKFMINL